MLGILHYIADGTDGVSLEIKKRIHALKVLGIRYKIIDYKELNFLDLKSNDTLNFLANTKQKLDKGNVGCSIKSLKQESLKFARQFLSYFKKNDITALYVHNLFTLPIKPAVSLGLLLAIKHLNIKVISIDHDFWQTREYFPRICYSMLRIFPPKLLNLRHQIINTLDARFLRSKNIRYKVIHDYWDDSIINFYQGGISFNGFAPVQQFIFLNASRIIKRKAIENSILFVYWFKKMGQEYLQERNKEAVLLLSNLADVDKGYLFVLRKLAKKLGVKVILSPSNVLFWNLYKYANVILYTTVQEGFGNQLLEAFYFEKPLVLFEYPVFVKDIKRRRFKYISLGHRLKKIVGLRIVPDYQIKRAVKSLIDLLLDEQKINKWTSYNKNVMLKSYGFEKLIKDIRNDIIWLNGTT